MLLDALSRPITTTLDYRPDLPVGVYPDVNVQTVKLYDNQGNVIWQRDALSRWTYIQYDALNRPVTTTINFENGNPLTVSPANQSWTDGSDTDIIEVTRDNADSTISRTIDNYVTGSFVASAPITDRVTQYGYDPAGRLITSTINYDPATLGSRTDTNRQSVTAYNLTTNQVLGQQDPLGRWSSLQYDALGRVFSSAQNCATTGGTPVNPATGSRAAFNPTYPDRNLVTQTRYDALGRSFETVDPLGHVTHTDYDGLGRAIDDIQNYVASGPITSDTNVKTQTVHPTSCPTVAWPMSWCRPPMVLSPS